MSSQNGNKARSGLRLPRADLAERGLLATILHDGRKMAECRTKIRSEEFSLDAWRVLWGAMCGVFDAGAEVDRVTVATYLQERGKLESIGGLTGMLDLEENMPDIVDLNHCIGKIREAAMLRRMQVHGSQIVDAVSTGETPDMITDRLNRMLIEMEEDTASGPVSAKQIIDTDGMGKILAPQKDRGIPLPWPRLNGALCGLHSGELIYIGARSSDGKTSLALQIGHHAAQNGFPSLVVPLEMTAQSCLRRMATQCSGVDWDRTRHGVLNPEERALLRRAITEISPLPLWFDDTATTVPGVRAAIQAINARTPDKPLALVIVDHIGLLATVGRQENRTREVAANSRALKLTAKRFGLAMVVPAQVNRESAKEAEKGSSKLTLHSLKETGDCENDADVVLLLQTEKSDLDVKNVGVDIAKQREGPRGFEIPFKFETKIQKFSEVAW